MTSSAQTARSGRRDDAPEDQSPSVVLRLAWLIGLTLWLLAGASMLSFDPADPPGHAIAPHNAPGELSNWIGSAGAFFAYHVFLMLGSGAWVLLGATGAALAIVAWRGPITQPALRLVGILILGICVSSLHALLLPTIGGGPEGPGGLLGITIVDLLATRFGTLGAILWLGLLAAVGATVAFDRWLIVAPAYLARLVETLITNPGAALYAIARERAGAWREARVRLHDLDDVPENDEELQRARAEAQRRRKRSESVRIKEEAGGVGGAEDFETDEYEEYDDQSEEDLRDAPQVFNESELRDKIARLPVVFGSRDSKSASEEDLDLLRAQRQSEEEADRNYVFPSLELLVNPEANFSEEMESFVREQAEALEGALHTYNIKGEVVGIESGPVITLYQVRLAPGTKVSSIQTVSSDIARALKAMNVRIVPNTEGMDTVGIEVPNRRKEKVRLKELMCSSDTIARMKLPLFLGKDASGTPLIHDLASMPHMLIAGTTGSGKSVCMSAIIMGFLYTQKPSDMKLILVDPKMVELSQFRDIPHLMCPVVTEMGKAAAILEWAVTKMDERYELLAEAGCRDISSYNALSWEEKRERLNPANEVEEAKIPRKLPYIVFIIDELADLMMTNKEVENSIVRIAQKARAVGIHLILATQRPQANVVTGLIKSNMPARIAFKVSSGMDSRIVLDQKGGELLLGQGDMLMITPRSSNADRAQGTLVDDSEIRRVVKFIRDVSSPTFERQLLQIRPGAKPGETPDSGAAALTAEEHEARMRQSAQEDPLFNRAVEIVLETRRGSVSLLQRRLAIGYTRASRLIELMGYAGIIGEHKGSVAREVLLSVEEWEAMKRLSEQQDQPEPVNRAPSLFGEEENQRSTTTADPAAKHAATEEHFLAATADDLVADDEEEPDPQVSGEPEAEDEYAGDDEPAGEADDAEGDEADEEYEYEYEYVDEDEEDPDAEYEYEYEYVDGEEADDDEEESDEPEDATDTSLDVKKVRLRDQRESEKRS